MVASRPFLEPIDDEVVRRMTRRLLADYADRLPDTTIWRCVDAARRAVRYFGEDPQDLPRVLERIVRADLDQIANGRDSGARIFGVHRPTHPADG